MKKYSFPHPLTLLIAFIFIATILSYFIPAGQFDRQVDEATGREVVISGSYHKVDPAPVGFFEAMVAIPRGMIEASDVIFLVFLIGGAFTVVDETKALKRGVTWLTTKLQGKEILIIVLVSIFFAIGGALENMQEEIIPLIPVLIILTNSLGFKPLVAVSMSAGPAFIAASFSPMNPFQVGIAQKLAQLPLLSGGGFRMIFLVIAVGLWIFWTIRYAYKNRIPITSADSFRDQKMEVENNGVIRSNLILLLVVVTFAIMGYGILELGWDFNQMSAVFFIMGLVAGLVGKLGLSGTAEAYIRGFKEMAFAGLLIGFARAIYVVLEDGLIIDSIVYGLFTPISELPVQLSAIGMLFAHIFMHVPVPSVSGQAVLTMPLLVPLSDLIGLSRQVTILAYQFGAGLTDLITPTNGALMAILAAAGIRYDEWFGYMFKKFLALVGIGIIAILVAISIGLN